MNPSVAPAEPRLVQHHLTDSARLTVHPGESITADRLLRRLEAYDSSHVVELIATQTRADGEDSGLLIR